ncbi:hypothetical protein [Chthonobacter albigriseus]|uniref:hypothetical protein n=1 Tax=Chthonobacter albigriseus TaxID=1683161 RepID=UPI0015EF8986|nr:hypothetical protein [Chthonobacter albigriseus]
MTEGERPAELLSRMLEITDRMNSVVGRNQDGSLSLYGDALASEFETVCDAMMTAEGESPDDVMALLWFVSRCSEAFLIGVVQDRIDVVAATRMKTGLDRLAGKLQRYFESSPGSVTGPSPASGRLN